MTTQAKETWQACLGCFWRRKSLEEGSGRISASNFTFNWFHGCRSFQIGFASSEHIKHPSPWENTGIDGEQGMWRRVRRSLGFRTMLEFCFNAIRITQTRAASVKMQHSLIFSLSKTRRGRFWICINNLVRMISSLSLITSHWGFTAKAGGSLEEHCDNTGEKTLPLPWNLTF